MRNILGKSCREYQNTHFMFSNVLSEFVPFMRWYRKIWWSQRPKIAIWRRVLCRISKATRAQEHACALQPHIHACAYARTSTHIQKYDILIAFPRQQWFRASASVLRGDTYIACLVTK
jgi:hypothetical protein